MKKCTISIIVIYMCIALTICFIWSNSVKTGQVSNQESGRVLNFIMWVFGNIFDEKILYFIVRKSAHFIEFAALGAEVAIPVFMLKKHPIWLALFLGLGVAVIDEFIQLFSDRTSSVSDVMLDFFGVLFGVLMSYVICYFIKKLRDKNGEIKVDDNYRDKT